MTILEKRKEIKKEIKNSKKIFIMAHKNLDLDALGSSIGMAVLLKKIRKECFLIIDDKIHELGVEKVLKEQEGCFNIINSNEIKNTLCSDNDKNLLIILDTNKKELLQNSTVLKYFSKLIIIDHHKEEKNSIKDGIVVIDENVSSTCEMITSLIEKERIIIDPYYATLILAGMVLDTNNFTLKTTAETFYKAYYLASLGASSKKVQYLLKQDLAEYTERQKLLTNVIIIGKVAIAKGTSYVKYRKEDLAITADTLLYFNDVEASFVVGKIDNEIVGISARSMGNFNINQVLKEFNGGGDKCNGAAVIENEQISKIVQKLSKLVKI